ncbi:hypothetical protein [Phycicoccus sonneratiae]|uniref:DUF7847 domain-containing protein n=1 Tax=Phycicoccus sonneratiae TaxID=2807628 RepID=A0ABS2CNR4_9MICO|nr:hypothetical protein [Phycicoccus sonneraticus]MBM6401068.1 hypothetical protein [Phycicoccus sonneraticus]
MEFRPGIIALRPQQIGDVYGAVLKAVRGNPAATIGLAALTTFAFLLPTTALGAWLSGQSALTVVENSASSSDTLPDGLGVGIIGVYLPTIGQLLSAILLAGFLAQVVGQAVLGRKVSMGETWRATRGRVPALAGAVLLTALAFLLVLLVTAGIPTGLIVYSYEAGGDSIGLTVLLVLVAVLATVVALVLLATKWAFATPAIVLERVGVIGGLRRSWTLVGSPLRGPFWRIFGIRALTGLIVGVASYVITLPITLVLFLVGIASIGDSSSGAEALVLQTVSAGIAGLITGALTTPFTAGVDALLYVDARIRTEGLDVRLIQATQGAAPPPWPLTTP